MPDRFTAISNFAVRGSGPSDVALISTTDQVAQFALAGPNSRRLLEKIVDPEFDISNAAFPFMAAAELTICGGVAAGCSVSPFPVSWRMSWLCRHVMVMRLSVC